MDTKESKKFEYVLVSKVSPLPVWFVRLEVLGDHWTNFEIYSVCYTDDQTIPPILMFLPEGWTASPTDAKPWSPKSVKTIEGHIKWDGCTEFKGSDHFCHGANSYRELHAVIQFTLFKASTFMNSEYWEPIADTEEEIITPVSLKEVPREQYA
jgi:hypothetical protein